MSSPTAWGNYMIKRSSLINGERYEGFLWRPARRGKGRHQTMCYAVWHADGEYFVAFDDYGEPLASAGYYQDGASLNEFEPHSVRV